MEGREFERWSLEEQRMLENERWAAAVIEDDPDGWAEFRGRRGGSIESPLKSKNYVLRYGVPLVAGMVAFGVMFGDKLQIGDGGWPEPSEPLHVRQAKYKADMERRAKAQRELALSQAWWSAQEINDDIDAYGQSQTNVIQTNVIGNGNRVDVQIGR